MDKQIQPWHIYTAIFVSFWALSSYFDNFFVTAVLCVAGGFGSDAFRRYLADGLEESETQKSGKSNDVVVKSNVVIDDAPTKPLPPVPEMKSDDPTEVPIQ
jgi:hypothetical protein